MKRIITNLVDGFYFKKIDNENISPEEAIASFDGGRAVRIPHDYAIEGDFDINNDPVYRDDGTLEHTGRTGGLPIVGTGVYKKELFVSEEYKNGCVFLEFDGVMSESDVFVNGKRAGGNHYGYLSFCVDITEYVSFGETNEIFIVSRVRTNSSRWYCGGGIFRPVRLVTCDKTHIDYNGVRIIPKLLDDGNSKVSFKVQYSGNATAVKASIISPDGKTVAEGVFENANIELGVSAPMLWDIESPNLYVAEIALIDENGEEIDKNEYTFGFRKSEFFADKGFFLNGRYTKFKGACLHHDLGLLGAAYNESGVRRQLEMLREMGCNAIRTTHNPPAPQFLDLCDRMGFLVIVEFLDEWKKPKCKKGYNIYFDEHVEADIRSTIKRDANHPCVIMWSIGNEIPEQSDDDGWKLAKMLNDICHDEDSEHPTTMGTNLPRDSIPNGFAEQVDIVGLNYKPLSYHKFHKDHPEYVLYGSETESTYSSRGEYKFPVVFEYERVIRDDLTVNAYETSTNRTYTAEREFSYQELLPYVCGQFTWTGFDYLGEPCPYDAEWPSRSAYFGIFDLAGLPKDRYWLFKSQWTNEPVLHLFPHWNWEGKEGQEIPVHCFTSFDRAELFVNGVSQGMRKKHYGFEHELEQYRFIWKSVPYEAGELKVVAYNKDGSVAMEDVRRTACKPARLILIPEKATLSNNTDDVLFIRVEAVDENGIFCPLTNDDVSFTASGALIRGTDNGDQRDTRGLIEPCRKLYNGMCVVAISTDGTADNAVITAKAEGYPDTAITIKKG